MTMNSLTPKELKERLDNGDDIVVIDVREDWELAITSVDFAEHIAMGDIARRAGEIPQDKEVVIMCRSGGRSMQVVSALSMNGWDVNKVYNLDGGILRWAQDVDPSKPTNY